MVQTAGGPQKLLCWHTEGIFRLIQSIPSAKAEPFKRWLAKVGYERVQEIENPELASKRVRAIYRAKGYSEEWIEKRTRSIAIRDELTGEWKKRGVKEKLEYSILTAEISKAAFGLTPSEYAAHKGLKRQNLRDHMTDLELIFSMLGEAATTEITRTKDAQGFDENQVAAKAGGTVAGNARRELEQKSGRKVVTRENYLDAPEAVKRLARKTRGAAKIATRAAERGGPAHAGPGHANSWARWRSAGGRVVCRAFSPCPERARSPISRPRIASSAAAPSPGERNGSGSGTR